MATSSPDRTQAPITYLPGNLPALDFIHYPLPNGVEVYQLNTEEELMRVEFSFRCGILSDNIPGVSKALSQLLFSGSSRYTAHEIQEILDSFGAYTDIDLKFEYLHVQVYVLRDHAANLLKFLAEIWSDLKIPEKEFELYKQRSIEGLKINEQKTSFLAKREFLSGFFGGGHPYGKTLSDSDYSNLLLEDVQLFADKHLPSSLFRIFCNCRIDAAKLTAFGEMERSDIALPKIPTGNETPAGIHEIEKKDAVQASIYLGFIAPDRKSEDHPAFSFLTTLFGGYFGSRLMKNIREEKGYTYGISAAIKHYPDRSLLLIRSDVKNENRLDCLKEIEVEIERLSKANDINANELTTVKNYLLGSFQRNFDGSLALCDRYRNLLDSDLGEDYYELYTERIKTLTLKDLLDTAERFYQNSFLYGVIAGNSH